ncbi:esterase B1-like [Haematobia irritans]|uniref:esterase B1-like n=1 Tax=Haematobia irritans TaxID=7368 RepID=UPI003F4F8F9C
MEINLGFKSSLIVVKKFIFHKFQQARLDTRKYEVITTNCGHIRGVKRINACHKNHNYYAFEGIPYGKPPVDELRFRSPEPIDPWKGILNCTQSKPKPLQVNIFTGLTEGSEDCLYLNVYTKKLSTKESPLPVMVWIYGGGFQIGEANRDFYGPDHFMTQDCIVVTLNYRVGVFGFLCLNDPKIKVPGNAGIKDQVLALRWIKENISHFNGDPNNITVFGESAGGASTHILMLTPQTEGLFHKAIIQSGSVLSPWSVTKKHDWGYRLACHLGYNGDDRDCNVYEYLMKQNPRRLATSSGCLLSKEDLVEDNLFCAFVPVVEPYLSSDCITNKPFEELLVNAWSNHIPLIIGGTSAEGLFHYQFVMKHKTLLENSKGLRLDHLLPDEVKHTKVAEDMLANFKKEYFGGKTPTYKDHLFEYLDLMGHRSFWHPIYRTIEARRAYASQVATYCYYFDCVSPTFNNYSKILCGDLDFKGGVAHGDDLCYLFHSMVSSNVIPSHWEYKSIERMIAMWYNFALSSNPNCEEISSITWESVENSDNRKSLECLHIKEVVEYSRLPICEKLKCWTKFCSSNI